ncbi:hypothetical protein ANCDUO_08448 [Ancylostoma duodenale]|uniref:Reverse transcriptase domain-containing protein n=1 Tax=Ancylostoma duodenale TaxID=51022 RepID=A0A0C2GQA4_9BILA|nr:hypothetical protein ANCDUO_08448 [Ancylostoma duodenale]
MRCRGRDWEDKGYLIDGKKISNLRFADDIVLVANNTAEMETMINEFNVAGLKIGLEMNMSKTQLMVNQWCDAGEVTLAGSTLQRVDSFLRLSWTRAEHDEQHRL